MIGQVYTIEEKEPPLNTPILTAGFFEANSNMCRYSICRYNGNNFISNGYDVQNVFYWAELKNHDTIEDSFYREIEKKLMIKHIKLILNRLISFSEKNDKVNILFNKDEVEDISNSFYNYMHTY